MSIIKTQINELLGKEMDRQEFLKHIAVGLVALSGASVALRLLAPKQQNVMNIGSAYGGSAYGGSESAPNHE